MKTYRIGVIGLGQRIAHVLAAMKEVGWDLDVAAYVDPGPVGAPILSDAGIALGRIPFPGALLHDGPYDLVMIGTPNHLHMRHLGLAMAAGYPIFAEKPWSRRTVGDLRPGPGARRGRPSAAVHRAGHALHAHRAGGDQTGG